MAIQKVWPAAGGLLSAIALFATANTVLITLVAASRLAFSLARDNEIPAIFARVSSNKQSPWIGALLAFATSIALLPVGNLKILAELSSFVALLAFLVVNLTLVVLRFRPPDHTRPFRLLRSALPSSFGEQCGGPNAGARQTLHERRLRCSSRAMRE